MQSATEVGHRSHISNHGMLTYPQHRNYISVKMEDDHYAVHPGFIQDMLLTLLQTNRPSHHPSMQYSYSSQNNNMDWKTSTYSYERQHLYR